MGRMIAEAIEDLTTQGHCVGWYRKGMLRRRRKDVRTRSASQSKRVSWVLLPAKVLLGEPGVIRWRSSLPERLVPSECPECVCVCDARTCPRSRSRAPRLVLFLLRYRSVIVRYLMIVPTASRSIIFCTQCFSGLPVQVFISAVALGVFLAIFKYHLELSQSSDLGAALLKRGLSFSVPDLLLRRIDTTWYRLCFLCHNLN